MGRPPAAPPRPVERRGGARRLDDRQRHLPHAGPHRRLRARAGADVRHLGSGRPARALWRPHLRRVGGAVPPLGRRLRLHPRGLRAAAGVPIRVDRAAVDPRVGAGGHRHAVRGIPAALAGLRSQDRAQRHVRALRRGRGHHPHGDPQLRRRALELDRLEPHHRRQVRRAGAARIAGVRGRGGPSRVLRVGARLGPLGLRRLGRPLVRGW